MTNINQLVFENLGKQKYLYRSGPQQNIKEFILRVPLKQHGDKVSVPALYATNDPGFAAGFCFDWDDSEGFKFGQTLGKTITSPWIFNIPKKYEERLNHPCSMYVLPITGAVRIKTKTPEYQYFDNVTVIKEIKFKTGLECLNHYGVVIKWV